MGYISKVFEFLDENASYKSHDGGLSWRGPCPKCGGNDRFLMFTDMEYPDWNFQCSLCGYKGWAHQITGATSNNGYSSIDVDKLKEEKEQKAKKNYEAFKGTKAWETFHASLTDDGREYWHSRGLNDAHIDYWMLGETDYLIGGKPYHAYTIPMWQGEEVMNINYRFLEEPDEGGRYRTHPGLRRACLVCDKTLNQERVLVVEGAIKAMVTFQYLQSEFQVIGVPSATSYPGIKRLVNGFEDITVILDPDALVYAKELAHELGGWYLDLPTKIDDGFNNYGMTKGGFERIFQYSRRRTM